MRTFKEVLARASEYDDIADVSSIARRYFAMNAFDGVVTIIGVLVGGMAAGIADARIILVTGMMTAVAMGISGLTGAYLTETAERERDLRHLEKQTLTDLKNTQIGRANRFAVVVVTIVDGMAPVLASAVVLVPFFAASMLPDIRACYLSALAIAMVALAALGAFLGHVSRGSMIGYAIKTTIAGGVLIALSMLFGLSH